MQYLHHLQKECGIYMNYKYDDRSFKGIEKMSFQLHCPARQSQRITNEFEKTGSG